MNKIRYITATDNSVDGYPRVCQLQYDNLFIDEVKHLSESLSGITLSKRNKDISLSLNVYGPQGIEVAFGDILHDDRAQGEFFEIEETEVFDGLPDETSFDNDPEIEFNNLVVTPGRIVIIGYNKNGDEISAEILIDDLNSFLL